MTPPRSIKQTATIADALGLTPMVFEFPCVGCRHAFAEHPRGICEHGASNGSAESKCECREFTGGFYSGHPRALRLRQLTNLEWSLIGKEYSPIMLTLDVPPGEISQEERIKRQEFYEQIALRAITHVRVLGDGGQPKWRPAIVKGTGEIWDPDRWETSIGEIAHPAGNLCWDIGQIVINDYNFGGPFGGVMPPFRREDARDVRVDGGDESPAGVGSRAEHDVPA